MSYVPTFVTGRNPISAPSGRRASSKRSIPLQPPTIAIIRRLLREGRDTLYIAILYSVRESVIWNALCRASHEAPS